MIVETALVILGLASTWIGYRCYRCHKEFAAGDSVYVSSSTDDSGTVSMAAHAGCAPEAVKLQAMGDRKN